MKKKLSSLLILIGFPFLIFAQAQLLNVKGRIVDEKGDPIIGANVIEVGNQMNGTVSDADGNFVIKVREGQSLSISYIGYLSQEVKLLQRSLMSF
jgi:hypothetical protein